MRLTVFAVALYSVLGQTSSEDEEPAEPCDSLCRWDSSTGACLLSRTYEIGLLERGPLDAARQVATRQRECEEIGSRGPEWCYADGRCDIDVESGMCVANRTWSVTTAMAPRIDGGLDLAASGCGLLGTLALRGAQCLAHADEAACESDVGGELSCIWHPYEGFCDVSRAGVVPLLRLRYRDEFVKVKLRRENCRVHATRDACVGECHWEENATGLGYCTIGTLEALFAVSGQTCPLHAIFQLKTACRALSGNYSACVDFTSEAGTPGCLYQNATDYCGANPMVLEIQLMQLLAVGGPDAVQTVRKRQNECSAQATAGDCLAVCTPAWQTTGTAGYIERPAGLAAMLALLSLARTAAWP